MKNIVSLDTKVKCCYCKQQGFFCSSIDEYSCPRCDHLEIWDDIYKTFKGDDIRCVYTFCKYCNIIYELGCMHGENGCCFAIRNAHFIKKYEYEGDVYEGMPQFENEEEWLREAPKIKVLEQICPNKRLICPKASYPIETHPQYYRECNLKQ
jgi:hypothetical protein